jgi:alkylation response protein AidB-like acyl-CoA dehydrogenase
VPCSTPDREGKARDEWVINGVKTWATNGGIANVHVVIDSVDPDLGPVERWHRDAKIFTILEGTGGPLVPGPSLPLFD